MPPPETEQARWFTEEVHAHEPTLKAYLRRTFPSVRDVDDVMQESYLRVWRARAAHPIYSARAFLFKVARHLALDLVRRERVSPVCSITDLAALLALEEEPDAADTAGMREKVILLADAIEVLPARCREVVILRKLHLISQRETAARLGIAEKTVEAQLARGIERCEIYLRDRGVRAHYGDDAS
jgi:RNA polymerase sigma factor (sigma-70 family)